MKRHMSTVYKGTLENPSKVFQVYGYDIEYVYCNLDPVEL